MEEQTLIPKVVKENKELSDFVNNYTGMNSNEFGKEIYQRARSHIVRKNVAHACIGLGMGTLLTLITAYADHQQKPLLALTAGFSAGFAGLYTLIRGMIALDINFNPEELLKNSKEYARTIIKRKIGAKQ